MSNTTLKIYCDASTYPSHVGNVAIACVAAAGSKVFVMGQYIGGVYNSTRAEMISIFYAFGIAEKFTVKDYTIYNDCEAAIKMITGEAKIKESSTPSHNFYRNMRREWKNLDKPDLQWVRSHTGNRFHDLADSIAKVCQFRSSNVVFTANSVDGAYKVSKNFFERIG